jgi:iron(III) transport system substrate-binding protein
MLDQMNAEGFNTIRLTAFEKQTGISVQVRTNDGIVLADQLLQEGRSSPADVYLTENSPELSTLDQHGRKAPRVDAQAPARQGRAAHR